MTIANNLIRIKTTQEGVQAVSARSLHEFLESKERFSKWFAKIIEYDFTEGEDYTPYQTVHAQNGQEITDYIMTLDMAKEAAMVSRLPKGKQARQYFIECERQLMIANTDSYMIADPVQRAQRWIEEEQRRQQLQAEIEEARPKIEYHDRVLQAQETSMNTREVAADYGLSAIALNRILMQLNIQYKRDGRYYLYSRYNNKGYVESKTNLYNSGSKSKISMKWTQAGREFIFQQLQEIGINPVGYDDMAS